MHSNYELNIWQSWDFQCVSSCFCFLLCCKNLPIIFSATKNKKRETLFCQRKQIIPKLCLIIICFVSLLQIARALSKLHHIFSQIQDFPIGRQCCCCPSRDVRDFWRCRRHRRRRCPARCSPDIRTWTIRMHLQVYPAKVTFRVNSSWFKYFFSLQYCGVIRIIQVRMWARPWLDYFPTKHSYSMLNLGH